MNFKKFHKFMKRGRLHKVIKASGIRQNSSEHEVRVQKTYPGEYVGGPQTQVRTHSDDSDDSWMTSMARANRIHVTMPLEDTKIELNIALTVLSIFIGCTIAIVGVGLLGLGFLRLLGLLG